MVHELLLHLSEYSRGAKEFCSRVMYLIFMSQQLMKLINKAFSISQIFIEWNLPACNGISELKNMVLPIFFIPEAKLRNGGKSWGRGEVPGKISFYLISLKKSVFMIQCQATGIYFLFCTERTAQAVLLPMLQDITTLGPASMPGNLILHPFCLNGIRHYTFTPQ